MSFRGKPKDDAEDGGAPLRLMCTAHGCPLHWAVKIEAPLCSYHAWEEPKHWPAITERLQRQGPWQRPMAGDSPTVADMKTRLRTGHKFNTEVKL